MKSNLLGITLIELVVAIAISGTIGTLLFSSLYQTNVSVTRFENISSIDYQIGILENQLYKDITGIFVPEFYEYEKTTNKKETKRKEFKNVFLGEEKEKNLKVLTFISNNSLQVYDKRSKPRIVRVLYTLEKENKSYTLYRQEFDQLDINLSRTNPVGKYEIADNIKNLKVEYISLRKEQKKDGKINVKTSNNWQNKEKNKIPQYIKINLTFWDLQQKKEKDFEFWFEIYSANIEKEELKKLQEEKKKKETVKTQSKPITAKSLKQNVEKNMTETPKTNDETVKDFLDLLEKHQNDVQGLRK